MYSIRELPTRLRVDAVEGTLEPLMQSARLTWLPTITLEARRLLGSKMVATDVKRVRSGELGDGEG